MKAQVKSFFDEATFTLTYIVYDSETRDGIIIDPVLDYDPASGKITTESISRLMEYIKSKELNIHYILETHAHADHLTGAMKLKEELPNAKVAIGSSITKVQALFKDVFNLNELGTRGEQFDILLNDNEVLNAGSISIKSLHTPGHTPACSTYLIDDMAFVGDLIFMPDSGTGRCDFPAGSSKDLYDSVTRKIYQLPDETKLFVGHDYQPGNRELRYQTTVKESKNSNIQLKADSTQKEFITFRNERDALLAAPKLLLPSIQVNIDAGKLPKAESNKVSYLKIPLKL